MSYKAFYRRSIESPETFWGEQAKLISWDCRYDRTLDFSKPPFTKWFVGGQTNLCYNAVDRHLADRGDQNALVYVSRSGEHSAYTYHDLYTEVNRIAAVLQGLGVIVGERVVIYMPTTPEMIFAMLACARLGAIHLVISDIQTTVTLSSRVDDVKPKLIITDSGNANSYKASLDEALAVSQNQPQHVLVFNCSKKTRMVEERDISYSEACIEYSDAQVAIQWLESNEPGHVLYPSQTNKECKGVQRDVGGYAVALAASMQYIFGAQPGEVILTMFDPAGVVGHSYAVYGPLINGMTTIICEGVTAGFDVTTLWRTVSGQKVNVLLTSAKEIKRIKENDAAMLKESPADSLRSIYLTGEPLDESSANWLAEALDIPIYEMLIQTETGWPILSNVPGIETLPKKLGSPGFSVYGYNIKLLHEKYGYEVGTKEEGILTIVPPLPPGCLTTVWGDDDYSIKAYYSRFEQLAYNTDERAMRDENGYYFIKPKHDSVISISGHELSASQIEKSICTIGAIAEAAVVGVPDKSNGEAAIAFVVLKDNRQSTNEESRARMEKNIRATVHDQLGATACPTKVHFVRVLPKDGFGQVLRQGIQALAEGRTPDDLSSVDHLDALKEIRAAMRRSKRSRSEVVL